MSKRPNYYQLHNTLFYKKVFNGMWNVTLECTRCKARKQDVSTFPPARQMQMFCLCSYKTPKKMPKLTRKLLVKVLKGEAA